MRTQTL